MTKWRDKAHREIAKAATEAFNQANTKKDGKPYKKRRPYSLPLWASELVECLGNDEEERAKAIFVHEHLRDF